MSHSESDRHGQETPGPAPQGGNEASGKLSRRSVFRLGAVTLALLIPAGYRLVRWLTRPTLDIAFQGPFHVNEPIPIEPVPNEMLALTNLELIKQPRANLLVEFLFAGQKRKADRMRVSVTLRDGAGKVLASGVQECEDQRIAAEQPVRVGRRMFEVWPENHLLFAVPPDSIGRIARIELKFQKV